MHKKIQQILNLTNSIQTQVVENPEQVAALAVDQLEDITETLKAVDSGIFCLVTEAEFTATRPTNWPDLSARVLVE
jgi:hypothetical protein